MVWRESVVIGETDMDPQEVQEVVQQLGGTYRGNAYHLLERNCNHFSDELCHKLTGHHAPPWVCFWEWTWQQCVMCCEHVLSVLNSAMHQGIISSSFVWLCSGHRNEHHCHSVCDLCWIAIWPRQQPHPLRSKWRSWHICRRCNCVLLIRRF